jgi:hypothetical protein
LKAINNSLNLGARLLLDGRKHKNKKYPLAVFFGPTVIDNVFVLLLSKLLIGANKT